jgi:hypothetical protein
MLGLSKKDDMLTVVALLLGLVMGIVVQRLTDESLLVILYVTMLVFGAYYLITVPFANNKGDFIPSQRSFRLVWGALLTTVGALLLVNVYAGIRAWVMLVIILLVIIGIILFLYMDKTERS